MRQRLVPQPALLLLVALAVVLLVGGLVTLGLGELLEAMGDQGVVSSVLKYIGLGCGVLFVVDLISLILAQALNALAETDDSPDEK
jgi:hypothetical protein